MMYTMKCHECGEKKDVPMSEYTLASWNELAHNIECSHCMDVYGAIGEEHKYADNSAAVDAAWEKNRG